MGNSVGGLKEYWDVFENEPMAQGGLRLGIGWTSLSANWMKMAIGIGRMAAITVLKGIPSFDNFCCNGLVSADREPHPHLNEVKKSLPVYQDKN